MGCNCISLVLSTCVRGVRTRTSITIVRYESTVSNFRQFVGHLVSFVTTLYNVILLSPILLLMFLIV